MICLILTNCMWMKYACLHTTLKHMRHKTFQQKLRRKFSLIYFIMCLTGLHTSNASKNVFEIQIETIKQTNPLITDEEIERITYAKGGYSVIIYHETLKKASPEMWQALFYVGSLMQLANDIFDMHKDVPDGIYTLPNRCTDFSALKKKYMDRVAECYRLIYALPYTKKNKTEFCIVMNFIISRGVVALDHFINLEKEKGRPLHIASLTRKEIICDMQKPSNILRWLKYMYTLPKTYLK